MLVGLADIFGDVAEGKLSVEGWVIGDLLNKLPNAVARVC